VVAHLSPDECGHRATSAVDGDDVPVRHFGAILPMTEWEALADKLRAAGTRFVIEPHVRFKGQVGEQATMFFLDPSGNALEFKAFGDEPGLREVTPHTIHPSQDNPARHDRFRDRPARAGQRRRGRQPGPFPIRRVFCVGRNYAAHAREMGKDPDREPPFFFTKPADAVVAAEGTVPYPPLTENLHHEIELVVAIGKGGTNVSPAQALDLCGAMASAWT
jgi:hypothetical protein